MGCDVDPNARAPSIGRATVLLPDVLCQQHVQSKVGLLCAPARSLIARNETSQSDRPMTSDSRALPLEAIDILPDAPILFKPVRTQDSIGPIGKLGHEAHRRTRVSGNDGPGPIPVVSKGIEAKLICKCGLPIVKLTGVN